MNVEGNIPTSGILRVFSIAEVESKAETGRIGDVIITVRWIVSAVAASLKAVATRRIGSSIRAVVGASPIYQGLSR